MSIEIRPLFGQDINQHFFDTLAALSPVKLGIERAKDIFRRRLDQGWRTLVAVEDGNIVGTASLLLEHKYTRGDGNGRLVGHVEEVAVKGGCQGKGIGAALMVQIATTATEKDTDNIVLHCSEQNVPFYEKLGYKRNGVAMRLDLENKTAAPVGEQERQ